MGDTPKAWIQENDYKLCVTRGVSECSQPCYIAVLLVMHLSMLCFFWLQHWIDCETVNLLFLPRSTVNNSWQKSRDDPMDPMSSNGHKICQNSAASDIRNRGLPQSAICHTRMKVFVKCHFLGDLGTFWPTFAKRPLKYLSSRKMAENGRHHFQLEIGCTKAWWHCSGLLAKTKLNDTNSDLYGHWLQKQNTPT